MPVLLALQRTPQTGVMAASVAGAAAFGTLLGGGVPFVVAAASVLLVFAAPLGLAVLLKRTGSLNLCFQVGVLGIAIALLGVHLVLDDPGAVWERWLELAVKSLREAGLELDGTEVVASLRDNMWGSYAALTLVTVPGALFLGRWWDTLVASSGTFGREFRQLKLGFWLGLLMTVTVIVAIVAEFAVVDALAWVAVTALAFEGLSAAHRARAGGRFGQAWLVLIYVLLIVPPTAFIMVALLAGWGFMDNWRRTTWRAA